MKKSIFIIALLAGLTACVEPEHPDFNYEESENIQGLVIKGSLVSDPNTEYDAVVDLEAGTAIIQVPFYLSDTKPVQGDLTKMKIKATLPKGAKFDPSIAGIHDLSEGVKTTLSYPNGKAVDMTITAEYRKSDAAVLIGLANSQIVNAVRQPTAESKGTFSVMLTPENATPLQKSELAVSPWATFETEALNADGTVDITKGKDITVVSQSGLVRNTYAIAFETPKTVDYGLGQVKALFGIQPTLSDPKGFTEGANRTLAVVGDYLIMSNSKDFTKMPVFDRFTGEHLPSVTVNTDGIQAGVEIRAITTDDAGHLFAVTYTSNKEYPISHSYVTSNKSAYGYLWKDGIDKSPVCIMEASLEGSGFAGAPMGVNNVQQLDLFNTVTVKGDLTSGEAMVATMTLQVPRPVFIRFVDGSPQWPAFVEWPAGLPGAAASFWESTKVRMLSNIAAEREYVWSSANFRSGIVYSKGGAGVFFDLPASHWWLGSSTYDHSSGALDYIEFNGAHILAVMNGYYAGKSVEDVNQFYWRCFVSDIGANPSAASLAQGFIFDTREGGIDGNSTNFEGSNGVYPTAMISPFAFESGATMMYGNLSQTTDVVFARGADGMSVQLYFMSTDQGLVGWNLTSLAL